MIISNFEHTTFNFPAGEMQVNIDFKKHYPRHDRDANLTFIFMRNEDIVELLLFCGTLKQHGYRLAKLTMPYVPFSRQDRSNAMGECATLFVFAELINSLGFEHVVITDPHSDVTPALIRNVSVIPQFKGFMEVMSYHLPNPYWLVSPDAGAQKKTYQLAKMIHALQDTSMMCRNLRGVIESSKRRETATGEITGTVVHVEFCDPRAVYVMVDDICDGGRTFIELAKALRAKGATKVVLYVTHGLFTKGYSVFRGMIDEIHTPKGKVFDMQMIQKTDD